MWAGIVVVDVDTDTAVGAKVDDVPFRVVGVRVIFLLGEKKDGVVVVALEGNFVHEEKLLTGSVDNLVDDDVVCDTWRGRGDWNVRYRRA